MMADRSSASGVSACLSLPGAIEKISHGEPTFFTPKRVFAMFANNHHDDGHIAVWLPVGPGIQEALIEEAGTRGRLVRGLRFTIANGKISEIEVIGNPARLDELDVSIVA
jgi:hypothetical protein